MSQAFLHDGNVLRARIPMPPKQQPTGAAKYQGEIAEGYDAKRESSEKWKREDEIMAAWLASLEGRIGSVLDIPVGTGRFLPLYAQHSLHVLGRDISEDMLKEAAKKAGDNVYLGIGDARKIDMPDSSVDLAVCCRLMRWLETKEMQLQVISELMRVAKNAVIFNVRTKSGPLPIDLDGFGALLSERGWVIAKREEIVEDFTFFLLERQDATPTDLVSQ